MLTEGGALKRHCQTIGMNKIMNMRSIVKVSMDMIHSISTELDAKSNRFQGRLCCEVAVGSRTMQIYHEKYFD
jgi:hypothetical protein